MNISYVNSNKTTSLSVELDALNNKDISYAKDFFLYIETQLKIAKDFLVKVFHAMNMEVEVEAIYHEDENTMDIDLEKKYQVLLQVKFFTHLLI